METSLEKFFIGSMFTALLLYIICLTHFHHILKASPQIYGRLPMHFLNSTTELHSTSNTARVLLWINEFSWNSAIPELREQGLWWTGRYWVHCPICLHNDIFGSIYFFFMFTTVVGSIHLFAGFICFSSVCLRNMRASIQITLGFLRRSPHTFCMLFQSAGG